MNCKLLLANFCFSIRHIFVFLVFLLSLSVMADRRPANFIPSDDIESKPAENRIWLQNVFIDGKHGVLKNIRYNINTWQRRDSYRSSWGMENTGLYRSPSRGFQFRFLTKQTLRYLDKRVSGEIREAKEGSTFHNIGHVHRVFKSNSTKSLGRHVSLKFRVRVLQGKVYMLLKNPYVESNTTIYVNGRVGTYVARDISSLGVKTKLEHILNSGKTTFSLDRPLYDNFTARFSSIYGDDTLSNESSTNRRVELMYENSF